MRTTFIFKHPLQERTNSLEKGNGKIKNYIVAYGQFL